MIQCLKPIFNAGVENCRKENIECKTREKKNLGVYDAITTMRADNHDHVNDDNEDNCYHVVVLLAVGRDFASNRQKVALCNGQSRRTSLSLSKGHYGRLLNEATGAYRLMVL